MSNIDEIRAEHEAVFGDTACPAWVRESLDHYTTHGIPTGDFLRAVLANDLMAAASRADVDSGRSLAAIIGYVYRHVPSAAHSSYEIVDAWGLMHREGRAASLQGDA
jgi:hypothetical protein